MEGKGKGGREGRNKRKYTLVGPTNITFFFFFFLRKFQPMVSALDDNSLSSDQDTNQFFGVDGD